MIVKMALNLVFYLLVSLRRYFSKIIPSFFTIKKGFFRKPTRPSLPLRKKFFLPLRLSCKESSTFSPSPSSSGSGDVTALRCSEPLRYRVGGPKRSSPCFAGRDRLPIILLKVLGTTPILKQH